MSKSPARHAGPWNVLRELGAVLGPVNLPAGRHVAGPARFDVAALSDGDHPQAYHMRASTTVGDAIREGALS